MKQQSLTVQEMGRLGGKARAAKLSKARRSAIAKLAAAARWKKPRKVAVNG